MTSGTNILSVSEQFQLPFVPGVSAARRKLSIPSCPSPWEEHTCEFQPSLRSWSPCCDPGGTAGGRLVTGQRTVCPLCSGRAGHLVCSHCGGQLTPARPAVPLSAFQDNSLRGTISPWLAGELFFKKGNSPPDRSNLFLQ